VSIQAPPRSIFVTAFGARGAVDDRAVRIQAAVPGVACRGFREANDMAPHIQDADVILGVAGKERLARATRLRRVHSPAAGPDTLLYPEMVASDIVVTGY